MNYRKLTRRAKKKGGKCEFETDCPPLEPLILVRLQTAHVIAELGQMIGIVVDPDPEIGTVIVVVDPDLVLGVRLF